VSLTNNIASAFGVLKNNLNTGRLAHAYLVVGMPHGNARVLAEQVLALLYCKSAGERPCGHCTGCKQAMEHTHADLMWLEPIKKSRRILLEQIRPVREHIFRTSFEGGWKTVVLVSADRLNEESSNRLLKTLEEPPAKCLFLLLTDLPDAILPTVVSRCQRIVLSGMKFTSELSDKASTELTKPDGPCLSASAENMTDEHEESLFQSAVIKIVTGVSGDSVVAGIARARLILDFLKDVRKQTEKKEKSKLHIDNEQREFGQDMKEILDARVEAQYRKARNSVLCWLLFWYRDVLLCMCGVDESVFYFRRELSQIKNMADGLTHSQVLANIRQIEDMKNQLEQNLSEPMVFEHGMMQIKAGKKR